MRKIKFALAAMALTVSSNAAALPPQVPDSYYDQMWTWVYVVIGGKRPCNAAGGLCNSGR